MKRTTIIVIIAIVAIIGLIGFQLASNKKKLDEKNQIPTNTNVQIPVTVATVQEGEVSQQLIKTGNLIPFREAEIMATAAGKVMKVNFELGSSVRQGATMVQVDNQLKELSLEATQLNIEKLKKDVSRYNTLYAGNATTELQVNDTKYNYDNAVNQAQQIKKQISDATIKAPISGRVVKKNIEPGEYVNVGTSLGTVLDISRLKVQVLVNESDVYSLKEGHSVKLTTSVFPDRVFNGSISYIAPQGDEQHNYPVEITIQNGNTLKAGTFVNVDFSQKSNQRALQIPRSALVESVKNPYVYVVEGQVVKQRKIQVGRELGDNIEVLSGLNAGEKVVTTGQINLSEGSAVQITK
ncbi:efflux RND transporter periplasmic adaptor subunit [Siphonobacter sp. SORGH_AS_0500]|uniref:efflux RND transporter periplasmic adaptor subunit n=1 Tax=Siphonobacter sp. SORGH_AS_0500 TaxID=1864824 RepID=UPI000CBA864A|nr:efflux RND transporter periplasmic adaptor subunit [Siphonobacter sp. SORGH_AS_0500]MDR6195682.1 multidrug efflux system membrane fusion protein [Siphonobacter sp. SORGH_AS_0500]PKK37574.1 efflux transporter periplasmic adaptor subunit [Siphonobacter sp. SORGH_AS_0500]